MSADEFWNGDVGGYIDPEMVTLWNTMQLDGNIIASATAPLFLRSITGGVGFDIDRRQRKNRSGRKKTGTGAKSPQWSAQFIYWTKEQYDAFRAILPQINPHLAANRMKTRKVFHPFLDDYGITQGIIHRLEFPQWEGQSATVTLYFEEIAAPDKDTKKVLKPTTDPDASKVAIDKDFRSDDGPPVLQSKAADPPVLQSR